MIYLKSADGAVRVVVLESANLDAIRAGKPAKTPDGSVLIAFTSDPVWLADQLLSLPDGDAAAVGRLIDESAKRPQKPVGRPHHAPHHHKFGG